MSLKRDRPVSPTDPAARAPTTSSRSAARSTTTTRISPSTVAVGHAGVAGLAGPLRAARHRQVVSLRHVLTSRGRPTSSASACSPCSSARRTPRRPHARFVDDRRRALGHFQTSVELLVQELRKSIEPLLGKPNFLAVLNGSRKRRLRDRGRCCSSCSSSRSRQAGRRLRAVHHRRGGARRRARTSSARAPASALTRRRGPRVGRATLPAHAEHEHASERRAPRGSRRAALRARPPTWSSSSRRSS